MRVQRDPRCDPRLGEAHYGDWESTDPQDRSSLPRPTPTASRPRNRCSARSLLVSDAANLALEKLHAEDFYRPAHQSIFESRSRAVRREPTDRRRHRFRGVCAAADMLERVGGLGYLTQLIDAVPAASNIEYYADIVEEHALRRRLMRAGGDIGKLATEVDQPTSARCSIEAEQAVFAVSERRIGEGLAPIDPLLGPAIERAEELHRLGREVTGISTGFRDLDRKLAGLHPTNLVIIAARPGMGKTTLALNIAQNVAVHDEPVAIFSLEMSREEIVSRMLCSRAASTRSGSAPGDSPTPTSPSCQTRPTCSTRSRSSLTTRAGLTVTEIRAKCRR